MRTNFICILVSVLVAGCAGREASPIKTVQSRDSSMTCAKIQAEIQGNGAEVRSLSREKDDSVNMNVAIGVAATVFFWPALFAMDTSDAEDIEIKAFQQRIDHLKTMHAQKCIEQVPYTHGQNQV